ncbi:MBL fold metallo-hydrolase [Paractinoplanes lichenicola]|uniref:MBL fold metallo-hydrolase n=1 Tax=Paractinoplanes lichenicola TaxID=2802976 RepID=A0ABS1VZH7_9ACTN|nr:MBL fold metallo-hydrolase [Actinoplanes lichenicola]MBL7259897.1 MBL fold metallo-hydrolase [Actinoplanes lichenicola]
MRDVRFTRRLLFTAGSGVLGVAILNACSSSSSEDSPPAASTSPSAPSAGTGGWERVNLSFVSAYLLVRGNDAAIVDLGTGGSADAIGQGLTAAGSSFSAVRHVILTHKHEDHAGGLAGVSAETPNAKIYVGQADLAEVIAEKQLTSIKDGDEVFGLRIVGTPGHTAGHISVFDPSTGTLVAGDALNNNSGLAGSDPQYTADETQAAASVKKLAGLDVKAILPGHGDPITSGAADALRKLAESL